MSFTVGWPLVYKRTLVDIEETAPDEVLDPFGLHEPLTSSFLPSASTVAMCYLADVCNSLTLRHLGLGTEELPEFCDGEDAPGSFDGSMQ